MLHVFGAMNRGGAELRTLDVMRRLDPALVHQEFLALGGERGSLDDELRALGGEVHLVPLGLGFLASFSRLLRERRIDVVHSHVALASGAILSIAAANRVPARIAHFRSTGDEHGSTPVRRVYRATMRVLVDQFATRIVGVSAAALSEGWRARWRDDPRCRVIYNGVSPARLELERTRAEVRRELGIPLTSSFAIHVGRFASPKNQRRALDAFVAAREETAHLVFVGRGGTPDEHAVNEQISRVGARARVHLLGERTDVPRLLTAADVLLLTSDREGLPGVVLEALAAGTPVIASDLPAVSEIAARLPGVTVVPSTAALERWGAAVADALRAPPGPAGRAALQAAFLASCFTIEAAATACASLWRDAVAPRTR